MVYEATELVPGIDVTMLLDDKVCQQLKHLKVCLREWEPIFDKIFLELGVSLLISRASIVTKLVEGDIFDSLFEWFTEPCIDEGCTTLYIICIFACKSHEMHRVIPKIIKTSESCNGFPISIDTPLADFWRIMFWDTLVVWYIVTLEPVLHMCITERFDKCLRIYGADFCSWFFELFQRTYRTTIPLIAIIRINRIDTRFLKVIIDPHLPPTLGYIYTRVWNPSNDSMFHAFFFEFFDIWLYICTLISRHVDIPEEFFLPGVLGWVPDIKSRNWTTRLEVWSIYLRTSAMIVEVARIFWWWEELHDTIVTEISLFCKNK